MSFLASISSAVRQAGLFVKQNPAYCAKRVALVGASYYLYKHTTFGFCTKNEETNTYTLFSMKNSDGTNSFTLLSITPIYKKLKDDSVN